MSHNKNLKQVQELLRLYQGGAVFTAFDTETTGLSGQKDRVIEIGAVQFNKDGIVTVFNQLINPCCPIPYEATRINNITQSMVQACPTEETVLPDFLQFIGDSILIAHNANFDLKFINSGLSRIGCKELSNRTEDTVKLSRFLFPELESHKLQFLAQHFNIPPGNAHRAQDDARVCMEVFLQCLKKVQ